MTEYGMSDSTVTNLEMNGACELELILVFTLNPSSIKSVVPKH